MNDNVMYAHTESGTVYTINWRDKKVTRSPGNGLQMRQDEVAWDFTDIPEPEIGEPLVMTLSPMSEHAHATVRITSPVVAYQPV